VKALRANGKNLPPKRLGLFGMEERAALVGGAFTIESHPGTGTSVYIEIPWEAKPHD
jgi:signal transduction histidine kinase